MCGSKEKYLSWFNVFRERENLLYLMSMENRGKKLKEIYNVSQNFKIWVKMLADESRAFSLKWNIKAKKICDENKNI